MPAGYSGTPQARKLGLKPGHRVALDDPPEGWELREPPDGLLAADPDGAADLIVAFFRAAAEIRDRLPGLARRVFPAGALWAAWPRRAAGHHSDITDNVIREHALDLGLVDVKVAALDEDWSALRLVWRAENRRRPPVIAGRHPATWGRTLRFSCCYQRFLLWVVPLAGRFRPLLTSIYQL